MINQAEWCDACKAQDTISSHQWSELMPGIKQAASAW